MAINWSLIENFSETEFSCKCCGQTLIHPFLVKELQKIRNEFGKMSVTSAYRCKKHNKKVSGADNSIHIFGMAVDIKFIDVDWNDKNKKIKLLKFIDEKTDIYRIGYYSWGLHLDIVYYPSYRYWKKTNIFIEKNNIRQLVNG